MRRLGLCLLGLGLAACTAEAPAPDPERIPGLSLQPGPRGLLVVGSGGLEIGFGRDRMGVLESIGRVEGASPVPRSCDVGRAAVETVGGLSLVFADERFVGWEAPDGRSAGQPCA